MSTTTTMTAARPLSQIAECYRRCDDEWQKLDAIPYDRATIDQLVRCDRLGDMMADLEIEAGGVDRLREYMRGRGAD